MDSRKYYAIIIIILQNTLQSLSLQLSDLNSYNSKVSSI